MSGTVQNSQYLDFIPLDSIGNNIRGADDNQLSGPLYPACPSALMMFKQSADLLLDLIALLDGGNRIVRGDKLNYFFKIMN